MDPWTLGSLAIWLVRLGAPAALPGLPEPYALEIAGDWRGAAAAWDGSAGPTTPPLARLGSPDEAGLRDALATFEDLGARGGRRRGPAADEGSRACGRSRAGPARPPGPPRPG